MNNKLIDNGWELQGECIAEEVLGEIIEQQEERDVKYMEAYDKLDKVLADLNATAIKWNKHWESK